MSSPLRIVAVLLPVALALAGCGDSRLKVAGTVNVSLQQLGPGGGSGNTGFTFPADTIVEGNPGGYCRVSGTRAEVRLTRTGGTTDGLRGVDFVVFATNPTGNEAPSATFTVDSATFASGGGSCTGTSTVTSSGELRNVTINLDCGGLRATGDARTASAQVRLELTNCTAQ